jgi:hypothetical protein
MKMSSNVTLLKKIAEYYPKLAANTKFGSADVVFQERDVGSGKKDDD